MNKERVDIYINIWLKNIRQEDLRELEQDIGVPLGTFMIEILDNLYNKYSNSISYIPVNFDDYSDYIIAPKNGKYSLEDFLLNRLLRSVTWMTYRDMSQTINPDSHYQYEFGQVIIDKNRIQSELKDVRQKRKVVAHEILHGIKTQFYNGDIFDSDRYYQLKEELKGIFGSEINDFNIKNNQQNSCKHSGITYSSLFKKRNSNIYENIDLTNLDEIFNELDAITISKDDYRVIADVIKDENYRIILNNPESSNRWITNYAFILERLVDSETLFVGLYIEPEIFYKEFNLLYTQIFQNSYEVNLSGIEILVEQLNQIKENPQNIDGHIKLLNTLYNCIDRKYVISSYNDEMRQKNIGCLGNKGLLEVANGRLQPLSKLTYCDEYNVTRSISKK